MITPPDHLIKAEVVAQDLLLKYSELAKTIPFGKIFLTISNDSSLVRSAHATYIESIGKYTSNTDALAAIYKIVEGIETSKKSGGAIALTLHPINGIISQITVSPSERVSVQY